MVSTEGIVNFTFRFRKLLLACLMLIVLFFGCFIKDLEVGTIFDDLMPSNHPYIKIFREFREDFGGANIIYMVLEAKKGDIFQREILQKVKDIQYDLHLIPAVNHYQVVTIASTKVKYIEPAYGEIKGKQLMEKVPQTEEGILDLKEKVKKSKTINGVLVSMDGKATLITAGFLDDRINYPLVFNEIKKIIAKYKNDLVDIYAVGHPMLVGYIYHSLPQTLVYMGITLASIVALLYFYFRTIMGVIIPLISGLVSAVIALGTFVLLNYKFDPLIVVVPFLITARAVSHTVQLLARFGEEYHKDKDRIEAAKRSMKGLFAPSILGIFTDAAGIFLIAVAPIPILQKLALTCGLWLLSIVVSVVFTVPILLSFWPTPVRMQKGKLKVEGTGFIEDLLAKMGVWATGKVQRWVIALSVIIIVGFSIYFSTGLIIGEGKPGSPIFWSDHEYNVDAIKSNQRFAGFDNLIVIIRGDPDIDIPVLNTQVAQTIDRFQHYMQFDPKMGGSISFVGHINNLNKIYHDGDRKWELINDNKRLLGNLFYFFLAGCDPGDFETFVSPKFKYAMISFFYRDHMGTTINKAIEMAKNFIAHNPLENAKFELAGGIMGVFSASNEVVAESQALNLVLIFGVVFFFCAITYRSFVAGLILIIPLAVAQIITNAFMAIQGIGLNVNTLPVASIGVGVGVDYGIYIMSRIKEEVPKSDNILEAISTGIRTTGRAIFFTGTTLALGVIFWSFSVLRFQAEMGLLLALLLIINMFGAIIISPTLISFIKPKFMEKKALI